MRMLFCGRYLLLTVEICNTIADYKVYKVYVDQYTKTIL